MTATAAVMLERLCPLCGELGRPALVSDARVDEQRLGAFAYASRKLPEFMHHRLVRCARCDLVYADPAPAPSTLAEAYLAAAFDTADEAGYASRTYGRIVDRIVDRLPSLDGALDIGTGDGAFLRELLQRGFTAVSGVEPSAAPIAAADPAVRPLIRHGVFEPGGGEAGSLSLVTCLQTIEHVPDPLAVCREAVRLLRPGGALVLVGHNRRALSARILGERSPIYDIEHLQLFSPASARRLLEEAGLVEVSVRPLVNRYPITYWIRLLPVPPRPKHALIRGLTRTPLHPLTLALPAGNMVMIGFRTPAPPWTSRPAGRSLRP